MLVSSSLHSSRRQARANLAVLVDSILEYLPRLCLPVTWLRASSSFYLLNESEVKKFNRAFSVLKRAKRRKMIFNDLG